MRSLIQYIKESVQWYGSGWEPSNTIQLIENHYLDKLTTENIKNQIDNLTNNKWNGYEWIKGEPDLNSEKDIEKWVEKKLKPESNVNYTNYDLEKFEELVKQTYDKFVNWDSNGAHSFVKNKNGEIIKLEDWLKIPCAYDLDLDGKPYSWKKTRTWEECIKEEWDKLQKHKEESKQWLIDFANRYLKNAKTITENDIRNVKLDDKVLFGSIAFGSGRMTRSEYGYLKIGDETIEEKKLFLEYTEDKSESIKLETVGDLLDLIYKYKEVKLYTPVGVLNTKYANSINIKVDSKFETGKLGILKFRS